jgi:hypothetical protein
MVACDNGTTGAAGTFTITNIPAEYNGQDATFLAIISSGGKLVRGVDTKINNGKAEIPLLYNGETYKGNDTFIENDDGGVAFVTIKVKTTDGFTSIVAAHFASVKFANGSAKKSWNDRLQ